MPNSTKAWQFLVTLEAVTLKSLRNTDFSSIILAALSQSNHSYSRWTCEEDL